jgi:hypothetical protein
MRDSDKLTVTHNALLPVIALDPVLRLVIHKPRHQPSDFVNTLRLLMRDGVKETLTRVSTSVHLNEDKITNLEPIRPHALSVT